MYTKSFPASDRKKNNRRGLFRRRNTAPFLRFRSNLRILGSGVIVYTLWELLKPLLIGLLIPETEIATAAEYTALPYSAGEAVAVLFSLIVVELAKKRGTQAIGIVYGGSALTSLSRLPGFAMHMVFGLIMGLFLGLARYKKQAGERGGGEACLALLLPVLWHTAYDAATGFNLALSSEDEKVQFLGVIVWLTVIGVSTVLQFVVLIRFKKKTGKYCAMVLQGSPDAA